jgi:hypothetical protein
MAEQVVMNWALEHRVPEPLQKLPRGCVIALRNRIGRLDALGHPFGQIILHRF